MSPSRKIRLAVLYGGRSGEHEVSIASATSVLQALDPDRYDLIPIYLTPQGRWLPNVEPTPLLHGAAPSHNAVLLSSDPQQRGLLSLAARGGAQSEDIQALDVVLPLLHGTYGEDGTVQGLLELADIPYVGSGVLASATSMDKGMMKSLFKDAGLPIVPHLVIRRLDCENNPAEIQERITQALALPVFVKPANLGSSVGIVKVKQAHELPAALDFAGQYDRRLIIEQGLDCREFECSVLGNDTPCASVIGEIIPHREFYDYQAKYTEGLSDLHIPAEIEPTLADTMRHMALAAFQAVDAAGLARIDFFVERASKTPYVNEINTMPGFTSVSMYPKLWEASGVSYTELLDRLIHLAIERHTDTRRRRTTRNELPPVTSTD